LTYINHVPKGDLWETNEDWSGLFGNWFNPGSRLPDTVGVDLALRVNIPEIDGAMAVTIKSAIRKADNCEMLVITFTAVGTPAKPGDVPEGLRIARRQIARMFIQLTSERAHAAWEME
jgi:hypothetical protein